jgi:hypothetical protein
MNPISKNNIENDNDIELNNIYIRSSLDLDKDNKCTLLLENQDDTYSKTDGTLIESLEGYDNVIYFLYLTSMIPPDYKLLTILNELSYTDIVKKIGYFIYYIFFRLSFIIDFFYLIWNIIQTASENNVGDIENSFIYFFVTFLAYSVLLCMNVFTFYSIFYIGNKLKQQSLIINIPYFSENISFCYKYIVFCICAGVSFSLNVYQCKYIILLLIYLILFNLLLLSRL